MHGRVGPPLPNPEQKPSAAFRLEPHEFLEIIDGVAHDVRNPLTVIGEYASLMRDGLLGSLSDEQLEVIDVFSVRADEIHLLIDSLQIVVKLACGCVETNHEACSIEDLLEDNPDRLKQKSAARQVAFELRSGEGLPRVSCDRRLARHVLIGLWWWTLRASPPDSSMLLEVTHPISAGQVCFRITNRKAHIPAAASAELDLETPADHRSLGAKLNQYGLIVGVARELSRIMGGDVVAAEESTGFEFHLPTACRRQRQPIALA